MLCILYHFVCPEKVDIFVEHLTMTQGIFVSLADGSRFNSALLATRQIHRYDATALINRNTSTILD